MHLLIWTGILSSEMDIPYIIEGGTVPEHQKGVVHKVLGGEIVQCVAVVQLPPDHRQIHGSLDDLVVVMCLGPPSQATTMERKILHHL